MIVSLSHRRVTRVQLLLVAALVLAHLAGRVAAMGLGRDHLLGLVPFFNLDHELNLPTFYSGAAILLAAVLAALAAWSVWREPRGDRWHWAALTLLLLVMTYDELLQLHEHLTPLARDLLGLPHHLYFAWTIPMAAWLVVLGLFFLPFLRRRPPAVRRLILASGVTFVTGAMGLEILGGLMDRDPGNVARMLVITLEETLEMLGIVLLVRGLWLNLELRGVTVSAGEAT